MIKKVRSKKEEIGPDEIPSLVAKLVKFQQAFAGIAYEDANWIKDNPEEAIKLFKKVVAERHQNEQLFTFVGVEVLPRSTRKFVAKDYFKIDSEGVVRISLMDEIFIERFLPKIEKTEKERMISVLELNETLHDPKVIISLGGERAVETTLQDLWHFIKKQGHGNRFLLSVDRDAPKVNRFYVRDVNGILCALKVTWDGYAWRIRVFPPEKRSILLEGYLVFKHS